MINPFVFREALTSSPLLLCSPHSGREIADDFDFKCDFSWIERMSDSHVGELISACPDVGVDILLARYWRAYVDFNRAADDLDPVLLDSSWDKPINPLPYTLKMGAGVFKRYASLGVPLYDNPLSADIVQGRLDRAYFPYHQKIEEILNQKKKVFGYAFMIDCHSMLSISVEDQSVRPDMVLSDLDGQSATPFFRDLVYAELTKLGYSVQVNHPFKGAEILLQHGQPSEAISAVQLEIKRSLYMDEKTLQKTDGFSKIQKDLQQFSKSLVEKI